jgi:catechol 2,3-dioxygenase-like lactoylglutathione lyase family enzyme
MSLFRSPQIVLFVRDVSRTAEFYEKVGFEEVFRTPAAGPPIHIDLALDGYRIGFASEASTREDHGMDPVVVGQRAAVILWTEDTPAAYSHLQELGARPVKGPEPWLESLLIAWVEDPDGHLIQVVQSTPSPRLGQA